MRGKLCTPVDVKRARRFVCVSSQKNKFAKTNAKRKRRRKEKQEVALGNFYYQGHGLDSYDLY